MYIALSDKYNNIVGNKNNELLSVRADSSYNNLGNILEFPPVLEGVTQFTSVAGVFKIENIVFAGYPGY